MAIADLLDGTVTEPLSVRALVSDRAVQPSDVFALAERHGVRVSLRDSPYGGTTAVTLIPGELLTEVREPPGARDGSAGVDRGRAAFGRGRRACELDAPPDNRHRLALRRRRHRGIRGGEHPESQGDTPQNHRTTCAAARCAAVTNPPSRRSYW